MQQSLPNGMEPGKLCLHGVHNSNICKTKQQVDGLENNQEINQ